MSFIHAHYIYYYHTGYNHCNSYMHTIYIPIIQVTSTVILTCMLYILLSYRLQPLSFIHAHYICYYLTGYKHRHSYLPTIYITIIQVTTNVIHTCTLYILLSYKLQPLSILDAHYIYYYHTSYNQCHSYMHTIYITIIQVTTTVIHTCTLYIFLSYKLQPLSFLNAHYIYSYHTSYNHCHSYMHTIYIPIIQVTTTVIHTCTLYIFLSYKLQPLSFIHTHYIYSYHTSYNHCHSYMITKYILVSYKLQPMSFIQWDYIYSYHTSYNQCLSYMHTIYITLILVTTTIIHICTLYILLSYKLQPLSFIHAHYI